MDAFRIFAIVALSFAVAAPAFAKSASRTRLLTSPNPSNSGQAVNLTAEVDGLGGGVPTGKVNFSDGSVVLGSATLTRFGTVQAILGGSVSSNVGGPSPHYCVVTNSGGVKCWGNNDDGQLGDGTTAYRKNPVDVQGLTSGVVAISVGPSFACAVTTAGRVKCWGANEQGTLGDGNPTQRRTTPVSAVGLSSGVVAISAHQGHACALTGAGAVKCWGYNRSGVIGDGTRFGPRYIPTAVKGLSAGVVAISSGGGHNCALTRAGAVECWGSNRNGQLGDGTTTDRWTPVPVSGLTSGVVAISAGLYHTCALTSAGAVKCWGYNHNGQLGDGTKTRRLTPVDVQGLSGAVLTTISMGDFRTCALTDAGAVKCWGVPFRFSSPPGVVAMMDSYGDMNPWFVTSTGGVFLNKRFVPGLTAAVRSRATLSTGSLGVGAHKLRATYSGDAAHTTSSGSRTQTILP